MVPPTVVSCGLELDFELDDLVGLDKSAGGPLFRNSPRPHLKRHHLQANVGHYGAVNGKRWEKEIYPAVRNLILAME